MLAAAGLGLVVGVAARWIVPGDGPGGVFGDVIVGIAGALAGTWLYGRFLEVGGARGISLPAMVCAFIGAVVLLSLLRVAGSRSVT